VLKQLSVEHISGHQAGCVASKLPKPAVQLVYVPPAHVCREYRVWDTAEETALRSGVKKHGLGAWERIRSDPEFDVLA
jgi:hypothetical protein